MLTAGCGVEDFDAAGILHIDDVTTGWLQTAGSDGQKIVPIVLFRLDNASAERLGVLQVNGVFRRSGEELEWGSVLIRAVGSDGLQAGASAGPFTLTSELGYTGLQSIEEKLTHHEFIDVEVELFVKHRASTWLRLGSFDIDRQLITTRAAGSARRRAGAGPSLYVAGSIEGFGGVLPLPRAWVSDCTARASRSCSSKFISTP